MEKDRKILTKSDGKKIITYPDGSWCDYNDLIDTFWKLTPNIFSGSVTSTFCDTFELKKNDIVYTPSSKNNYEILYNFNKKWSIKNNAIELSLINKSNNEEKFLLNGEIVFEESSRFIVGNFYKSTFSEVHNNQPLSEFEGKFTATEVKLEIPDE